MPDIEYVVCPLCAWSRVLVRKGSLALLAGTPKAKELLSTKGPKGAFKFGVLDPETMAFIQRRQPQGKGKGFTVQTTLTIQEAMTSPEYQELLDQARQAAKALLAVLGEG